MKNVILVVSALAALSTPALAAIDVAGLESLVLQSQPAGEAVSSQNAIVWHGPNFDIVREEDNSTLLVSKPPQYNLDQVDGTRVVYSSPYFDVVADRSMDVVMHDVQPDDGTRVVYEGQFFDVTDTPNSQVVMKDPVSVVDYQLTAQN